MRTTEEIINYQDLDGPDVFGFDREALVPYLTFEEAESWRAEETTKEQWGEVKPRTREVILDDFKDYMLRIALDKAVSHRGLSASRSIAKLRALAWLMEDEEAVRLCDESEYANYGAPKLRALCDHFEIDWRGCLGGRANIFEDQSGGRICCLCANGSMSGCGQ